jgi:hypothetical protein
MDGEQEKETIDIDGMAFDVMIDTAETVIAKHPSLFQKSGELVNIVRQRSGMVGFNHIHSSFVRYLLSKAVSWVDGEKGMIHPPPSIGRCLLEKDDHGPIKHLRTVVAFPPMDGAGSICVEEGYNKETEVYFSGGVKVTVKDKPTKEDAQSAIAELLDIVVDFPFAGENHKAAWIAAVLTPLTRFMHSGNFPLAVFQSNGPRIGKTRLAKIISLIVTGADCPFILQTNQEEERKRMLSFLKLGRSIGLIDNVTGEYGGANLAAILTSRFFEDRTLGHSKMVVVSNDCFWMVSGNNIILAPDISERSLNVRLQCDDERPNLRTGWKHEDLFKHVLDNRQALLSAAMTILKAYITAGKPKQNIPQFGSFEEWNDLVCGALVWAGMANPTSTREELEQEADIHRVTSCGLVDGWLELQAELGKFDGMTAREARDALVDGDVKVTEFRDALLERSQSRMITAAVIGRHLRTVKDINFGGRVLKCVELDSKKGNKWATVAAKQGEKDVLAEPAGG